MKKTISALFASTSLLLSVSAFSAPKVGDQAYMEGTLLSNGATTKVTTTQTILAFAPNTGVYTVRQIETVGGKSETKDENVSADDLMSEETAAQIVGACESSGIGTLEKIQVKAGTFNTCKLKADNGSALWVAVVPFGIVRLQSNVAAGFIDLSLYSYVRGTK